MAKLSMIEGIGEGYQQKLNAAGIASVEKLLAAGGTRKGREELAEKTGIAAKLLMQWINHADLFRIKGIGSEYSDLLEAAGVDTVPELAQRKAENLFAKMTEVNAEKKLVRKMPVLKQVEGWVEQAGQLPRAIQY